MDIIIFIFCYIKYVVDILTVVPICVHQKIPQNYQILKDKRIKHKYTK